MSTPSSLPSGWFPDPHGRHEYRWFNGTAWTADVSDDGQRLVDPYGAAPLAGAGARVQPGHSGNGIATASLTCGLIALVFAWMPLGVVIGLVLAVLALVFGIRGRRRAQLVGRGGGVATAGTVLGIVGLALSVVGIALTVSAVREVSAFLRPGLYTSEVEQCRIEPGAIVVTGALTNLDDRPRSYTVYAVVESPAGVADFLAETGRVAAGDTIPLTIRDSRITAPLDSSTCEARFVVHGPLPWGLEMERVDD